MSSEISSELKNKFTTEVGDLIGDAAVERGDDEDFRELGESFWFSRKKSFKIPSTILTDSNNPLLKIEQFQQLLARHPLPENIKLVVEDFKLFQRFRDKEEMVILKEHNFEFVNFPSQFLGISVKREFAKILDYIEAKVVVLHPSAVENKAVWENLGVDPENALSWEYAARIDYQNDLTREIRHEDYPELPQSAFFVGSSSSGPLSGEDLEGFLQLFSLIK